MQPYRLRMKRGDAPRFPFQATQRNPATNVVEPIDLTSGAIALVFTAKHRLIDADPGVFQRTRAAGGIVVTTPLEGRFEVRLAAANTAAIVPPAAIYFDIQMTSGSEPSTLLDGILLVEPDVTLA